MKELPEAHYKAQDKISWSVKVNLALNSDVMKTHGVFNKQLAELDDCALKLIVVKKDEYSHEHEIKLFLDTNFVHNSDKKELSEKLHTFIQEYLNLNKMVLGSFKTNFVENIKSLDLLKMEKVIEPEPESRSLSEVLAQRRMRNK